MTFSKLINVIKYCRPFNKTIEGILTRRLCDPNLKIVSQSLGCRAMSTSSQFKDKLKSEAPTEYMIYDGPLTKQIRNVKVFSLLTSTAGVLSQPFIFERANELGTSTPALVAVCSVVGFFTFITPFLLHLITRKYITTVTYNPYTNAYKATTFNIFVRPIKHDFKPGEMMLLNSPSMFGNVALKGQPLFLDARFFDDLDHYKKIMGFDKPMDFKMSKPAE